MPANEKTTTDLTKYQGRKRGFGFFKCICNKSWASIGAWANTAQKCRRCLKWTFPFVIRKFKKGKGEKRKSEDDPELEHVTNECQMCRRLGQKCITRDELSKDVHESQRRDGKKFAKEQNAMLPNNKPNSSAPNNGQNHLLETNNKQGDGAAKGKKKKKSKGKNQKRAAAGFQAQTPIQNQQQQVVAPQPRNPRPPTKNPVQNTNNNGKQNAVGVNNNAQSQLKENQPCISRLTY